MIIGLSGLARSGKDTVADYLVREHQFVKLAYADPIKDMICAMLSINRDELEEYKDKTFMNYSIRNLLQTLGTEWGRETIDYNIWLNLLKSRSSGLVNFCVSDVRFENEARQLRMMGGIIVKVVRPELKTNVPQHSSEQGVDADKIIVNNKDLNHLYSEVQKIVLDT